MVRDFMVESPGLYPRGFVPVAAGGDSDVALMAFESERFDVRALKIPLGAVIAQHIARIAESRIKPDPGWIDMAKGYGQRASKKRLRAAKGQRVLVFVHGIISSIHGAFDDLGAPDDPHTTMGKLVDRYHGNVFGYDHWTISKTPIENTIELLNAMPQDAGWDVDIVCHSRGGLIVRALLADPDDASPLEVHELLDIRKLRQGRIAKVRSVIFVGGANQGSPLAHPTRVKGLLKVLAALASRFGCLALDALMALARASVSAAYRLPSIHQLDGETSELIADLNRAASLMDAPGVRVFGVRANFDPSGWDLTQLAAAIEAYVMPEPNDLVVPFDGVVAKPAIPSDRQLNFDADRAQSIVWHTHYFEHPRIQGFLLANLEVEAAVEA
jgi:hypothetical protein